MSKALYILKSLQENNRVTFLDSTIDEAVKELEELMKPKSCEFCVHYVSSHNECVNDEENCYIEPLSKDFSCSLFMKKDKKVKDNE